MDAKVAVNKESITIRTGSASDLDRLCDMYFESHEFHARHLPGFLRSLGEPTEQERKEVEQGILKILNDNDAVILVAENSGRVIGFAEVHLRQPEASDRAKTATLFAHLQSLVVTEVFRRKGVGARLLKSVEDWAHLHGASELRLDIWEFSAGPLEFYIKSGYRTFRRSLIKDI